MNEEYQRCPYCGSTRIVFDYWNGKIVCMNCGSVISELIYYKPVLRHFETGSYKRKAITLPKRNRTRRRKTQLVWNQGKYLKLSSFVAYNIMEILPDNVKEELKKILNDIEKNRKIAYRSIRVKIGLAYAVYLYTHQKYGVTNSVKKAASLFYLSEINLRKVFNLYIQDRNRGTERHAENSARNSERNTSA